MRSPKMAEPAKTIEAKSSREILRELAVDCPPSRFLDYRDFLRFLRHGVAERVEGKYTYQDFSRDLGFESHHVTYVLVNGLRRLTKRYFDPLAKSLGLPALERRFLSKLVEYTDCTDPDRRSTLFRELVSIRNESLGSDEERRSLQFFNDWSNAVIFEMTELPNFVSDPEWIASRLYPHVTPEQAKKCLQFLEESGLIRYDPNVGRHVKLTSNVKTGDKVRGLAIAGYHLQALDLAKASLSQVPSDERELGAVTVTLSEEKFQRLQEDVNLFKRYVHLLSEQSEEAERVVQLNFQLFAMTKPTD